MIDVPGCFSKLFDRSNLFYRFALPASKFFYACLTLYLHYLT